MQSLDYATVAPPKPPSSGVALLVVALACAHLLPPLMYFVWLVPMEQLKWREVDPGTRRFLGWCVTGGLIQFVAGIYLYRRWSLIAGVAVIVVGAVSFCVAVHALTTFAQGPIRWQKIIPETFIFPVMMVTAMPFAAWRLWRINRGITRQCSGPEPRV
jgi:hypothetical protein